MVGYTSTCWHFLIFIDVVCVQLDAEIRSFILALVCHILEIYYRLFKQNRCISAQESTHTHTRCAVISGGVLTTRPRRTTPSVAWEK